MKILKIRPAISRIIKNLLVNRLSKILNRPNVIELQNNLDCIFKSDLLLTRVTSKTKYHRRVEKTGMAKTRKNKERKTCNSQGQKGIMDFKCAVSNDLTLTLNRVSQMFV